MSAKYFVAALFAAAIAGWAFLCLALVVGINWLSIAVAMAFFGFSLDVCLRGSGREGAQSAEGGDK